MFVSNTSKLTNQNAAYNSISIPVIDRSDLSSPNKIGSGTYGDLVSVVLNENMKEYTASFLHNGADLNDKRDFQRLSNAWALLESPLLVPILYTCFSSDPFLVLLPPANLTLKSVLKDQGPSDVSASSISVGGLCKLLMNLVDALRFLDENDFIHNDLGTRAVHYDSVEKVQLKLLDIDEELNSEDYYKPRSESKSIPVRWLAPEAFEGEKTRENMVWMFGVLCWEVFSFANKPYTLYADKDVQTAIRKGAQLDKPKSCPTSVYMMILACCDLEVVDRPSVTRLWKAIHALPADQLQNNYVPKLNAIEIGESTTSGSGNTSNVSAGMSSPVEIDQGSPIRNIASIEVGRPYGDKGTSENHDASTIETDYSDLVLGAVEIPSDLSKNESADRPNFNIDVDDGSDNIQIMLPQESKGQKPKFDAASSCDAAIRAISSRCSDNSTEAEVKNPIAEPEKSAVMSSDYFNITKLVEVDVDNDDLTVSTVGTGGARLMDLKADQEPIHEFSVLDADTNHSLGPTRQGSTQKGVIDTAEVPTNAPSDPMTAKPLTSMNAAHPLMLHGQQLFSDGLGGYYDVNGGYYDPQGQYYSPEQLVAMARMYQQEQPAQPVQYLGPSVSIHQQQRQPNHSIRRRVWADDEEPVIEPAATSAVSSNPLESESTIDQKGKVTKNGVVANTKLPNLDVNHAPHARFDGIETIIPKTKKELKIESERAVHYKVDSKSRVIQNGLNSDSDVDEAIVELVSGIRNINITKSESDGFGFVAKGAAPVLIQSVDEGCAADVAGLRANDVLISIDGVDVWEWPLERVVQAFKSARPSVVLIVKKLSYEQLLTLRERIRAGDVDNIR